MESKRVSINGYDLLIIQYQHAGKPIRLVGLAGLGASWGLSPSDLSHQYYAVLGPSSVIYRYPDESGQDIDCISVDDLLKLTTGLCPKYPKIREWIQAVTLEKLRV